MFQLRFLAGALLGVTGFAAAPGAALSLPALAGTVLGAVAWLCVTWHIYLLNGICDQTEDRHNGSGRPLASGALPLGAARGVAAGLALVAIGVAALLSWPMVVTVVAMLALGWAYSAGPRPQKANMAGFVLVVTAGGLLTYLAGWLAVGAVTGVGGGEDRPSLLPLAVLAGAMSLWMSLGGMTKDLSDVSGDRAAGRRTLPVLLGDRRARVLMGSFALAVGAGLAVVAAFGVPVLRPAAGVLLAGGCAVAACLAAPASRGRRSRLRLPYRAFMTTQYAVHGAVLGQCLL
ncbi:UbiA family prenyltransferase [Plantactinospora sp. CA-290183]|uniref:UbiA family prenyltransferase n=1 Tax=Plantactinospora sp. CA-290183 TaxID=3240006 RepID=UPI003D8FB8BD